MKPLDAERQNRVQEILERVTRQGLQEHARKEAEKLKQQRKEK